MPLHRASKILVSTHLPQGQYLNGPAIREKLKNKLCAMYSCGCKLIYVLFYRSSFVNQGEICLCTSRVYVQRDIFQDFLGKFLTETRCVITVYDIRTSKLASFNWNWELISEDHVVIESLFDHSTYTCFKSIIAKFFSQIFYISEITCLLHSFCVKIISNAHCCEIWPRRQSCHGIHSNKHGIITFPNGKTSNSTQTVATIYYINSISPEQKQLNYVHHSVHSPIK